MDNNPENPQSDMNPEDAPPEDVPCPNSSTLSREVLSSRRTLADTLVDMWKAGGDKFPSEFTSEGSDDVKLRELEGKCAVYEKINSSLQQKLSGYEGQMMKLQIDLKKEESEKKKLMERMTTIWDYMKNITEAMNYCTETLDDCKEHCTHLESDYDNVITKITADNESLKNDVGQLRNEKRQCAEAKQQLVEKELHLSQQREQIHLLQTTVEDHMNKLQEQLNKEKELQKKIEEFENFSIAERKKMESALASERQLIIDLRKSHKIEIQKLSRQIEELAEGRKKLEDERNDVFRTLVEKEEEIKAAKQSINDYKINIIELQSQLTEKAMSCQRANEEKNNCQLMMEEKKKEISQIKEELEAVRAELTMKSIQLNHLEELKHEMDQELEKTRCAREQTDQKFAEKDEEYMKQSVILQQKVLDTSAELQKLQAEYKILVSKSKDDTSEIDRLTAELSRSSIQLMEAQNEREMINQKLSLMDSTKENEVSQWRTELDCLNQEMHKQINEITAEKTDLQLKYDEMKQKYDNECNKNQQDCQNYLVKMGNLDSELAQLRKQNLEYSEKYVTMEQQLKLSAEKLEKVETLRATLTNNLQRTEEILRVAENKIRELEKQNNSSDMEKDEIIKLLREKLINAEEQAKNFSEKYQEIHQHLNNKIKELNSELMTARKKVQTAEETIVTLKNSQKNILQSNELTSQAADQKMQYLEKEYHEFQCSEKKRYDELQKNFDNSTKKIEELQQKIKKNPPKKIQEVEKKYEAILKEEKEKNQVLQKKLEESEKKAKEYEEKYKTSETQGEELTKKISEIETVLQDPVSPSSWKKPSLPTKKVNILIRSDEILPAGSVQKLSAQSPSTPKKPKSSIRSPAPSPIRKTAVTPTKPVKSSSAMNPAPSPKGSPLPVRRRLSSAVTDSLSNALIASQPETPRPLSPDSCTMDVDPLEDDDMLEPKVKAVLGRLTDYIAPNKSPSPPRRSNNPAATRRFFKSRASQPK